jgi:catechol 2,3-dioxygenase-like lactoylglutathione lyase family enzyme
MKFKMAHFGLLCKDMEKSLAVYHEQLDNQVTFRVDSPEAVNIAFVGKRNDTTVELVGQPFLPYEDDHLKRHGYSINHLSFQVDNADKAFEELKKKGVKVAWELKDIEIMRQCGFYDADGMIFKVYSYLGSDVVPTPDLSLPIGPTDLTLNHLSIVTSDMTASERFYVENLGLRRVAEYFNEEKGGFVFLVDPFYDGKEHGFMLEIIGPPGLEKREEELLNKRGPLFDHICYTAADVKGAWQAALAKGAENFIEPYEEYGIEIAWIRDADGNDIEIMSPFPQELIDAIVNGAESINLSL